jgi:hypothetical protein
VTPFETSFWAVYAAHAINQEHNKDQMQVDAAYGKTRCECNEQRCTKAMTGPANLRILYHQDISTMAGQWRKVKGVNGPSAMLPIRNPSPM